MKRVLSLVLALSMVLGMFSFSFASSSLKDIEGTEYEAAVEALVKLGVVSGYENNTYQPERVVSRAEMAKLLVVAAGLEPAAEVATGATRFSDVPGSHWASGYINVAAEYGYIVGYPDGTFHPDTQVKYSEAVTMALRVLGYRTVVEAKGTWPTNYIAKAQDLKMLDDITYKTYADGAIRGNVAKLVWNMLRTIMWDVNSENETNGLNYTKTEIMLNVKFPDYKYSEVTFEGFEIDGDGEVVVTLDDSESDEKLPASEYKYVGNDFYTFVPGETVEVLVNTSAKDSTLLTMVPTGDDKLVDGDKDSIDDDYEELQGVAYDYAYVRVEKKAIVDSTILSGASIYVDELDKPAKKDYIKINGDTYNDKDWDYELILKDGERVTLRDIKEGDILTTVSVLNANGKAVEKFYVIGSSKVEGEFTRFANVKYENSDLYYNRLTLGKEKYVVDSKATYVEDPSKDKVKSSKFDKNVNNDKMEGEDVTVYLDAMFGKVVRVEFDGKIDSGNTENTRVEFVALTGIMDYDDGVFSFEYDTENETGKEYKILKRSEAEERMRMAYAGKYELDGTYAIIKVDDDDYVTEMEILAGYEPGPDGSVFPYTAFEDEDVIVVPYGAEDSETENYILMYEEGTYNKTDKTLPSGDSTIKVDKNTVLVKLVFDDKGDDRASNDEYRVEFEKGFSAFEKALKTENEMIIVYDQDTSFTKAKYVVIFSDTSDNSDNEVAKVVSPEENEVYVGGNTIDLEVKGESDNVTATLAEGTKDLSDYELLVYTMRTNSRGKNILTYVAGLNSDELSDENTHGYVKEIDDDAEEAGRVFIVVSGDKEVEIDLDDDDFADKYEDFMVVLVDVESDNDNVGEYDVTSYDVSEYAKISVAEGDRISIDENAEVIFIISGMDKIDEEADDDDDDDTQDDDDDTPTGKVEITFVIKKVSGDDGLVDQEVVVPFTKGATPEYEVADYTYTEGEFSYTGTFTNWEGFAAYEDLPEVTTPATYTAKYKEVASQGI